MKIRETIILGVLGLIIVLSGCTSGPQETWEEVVEVLETKTEIDKEGRVNYYFKSNSSVTSDWIHAIYYRSLVQGGTTTRLIVGVGDLVIIKWIKDNAGIKQQNVWIYED